MSFIIDTSSTSSPDMNGTGDSDSKEPSSSESSVQTVKCRRKPAEMFPDFVEPSTELPSGDVTHSVQTGTTEQSEKAIPKNSLRYSFSFKKCLLLALCFRLTVLVFSVWQDTTRWPDGQLRFTDVDYDVFTDAALAMLAGQNIYESRPTYRYSPIIAALVAPGHLLFGDSLKGAGSNDTSVPSASFHPSRHVLAQLWGKLVFIFADLGCASLQYRIIQIEAEQVYHSSSTSESKSNHVLFIALAWLFNPITAIVSVRGNAESVVGLCVLACLYLCLRNRLWLAGLFFGLCVHLKMYPIIYAPAVYAWIAWTNRNPQTRPVCTRMNMFKQLFCPRSGHFKFALTTLVSMIGLTGASYAWFGGMKFLRQAYLFHFTRVDLKHNFAPHFYPLYLLAGVGWRVDQMRSVHDDLSVLNNFGSPGHYLLDRLESSLIPAAGSDDTWIVQMRYLALQHLDVIQLVFRVSSILPIVVLVPALSVKLARRPGLCWFVITHVFVTFNRVCTSQYFLWSLVLLPVALANIDPTIAATSRHTVTHALLECILLWLAGQALWLASAYTLEMQITRFPQIASTVWSIVWITSLIFFMINIILARRMIRWRKALPQPLPVDSFPKHDGEEIVETLDREESKKVQ